MPLYALYALLFARAGLSDARISVLFAIWSAVGILAEVPTGVLADAWSRRGCLVAAGVLQGAAYAVWLLWPTFGGFAAGFVVWGLAGSLGSGASQALMYDGLMAVGAAAEYSRLLGRVTALGLFAQLPAAGAATVLYGWGGFPLVGWVSVGMSLLAAGAAWRLPDVRTGAVVSRWRLPDVRTGAAVSGWQLPDEQTAPLPGTPEMAAPEDTRVGGMRTLRGALVEVARRPVVLRAVLMVALLTGIDALEEYFPLLAQAWGVPTRWVPLAILAIPLAGAIGAALGGRCSLLGRWALAGLLAGSASAFLVADGAGAPPALGLVAVAYGLYRFVLVVVDVRLQHRIVSDQRATVTSLAAFCTEFSTFLVYAAWAAGGLLLVAAVLAAITAGMPALLGRDGPAEAA